MSRKKPLIMPNKKRRCIFTGLQANRLLVMGNYTDQHSPVKKAITCDSYLSFREERMNWELEKREREIFTIYWKLELEMVFGNVNQIDFSELKKLQGENLEAMRALRGDFDIDAYLAQNTEDILNELDNDLEYKKPKENK